MNADELLRQYGRIADAPDAVTRLRRFVLELAVRGKLLPQIPGDEHSADLWAVVGDVQSSDNLLPSGWLGARVGQLLEFRYGKGLASGERSDSGPTPVFGSNGVVGFTTTPLTKEPAIIVGRKGSAGALNVCDGPSWTTDVAYFIEPPPFFQLRYLYLALSVLGLDTLGKGVKPGLSRSDAYELELWVPPLVEQHRIVAKVDELMGLCDRLETARAERETARDRLTTVTLARLNTPDPETFADDARFALDVLPALAARPDQIKQLRQTILGLAVRGRLVRQVATDAPAVELLAAIEQRRSDLLLSNYPNAEEARAQIRKQSDQIVPSGLDALPTGWAWATLMQCALLVVDCKNKTAPYAGTGVRLVRTTNVRDGRLNSLEPKFVSPETYEVWSARCKPAAGDILITREAPMGEVCVIPENETVCLGQRMMLVRLVEQTIDPAFLLYSLRDPYLMNRVQDKPIGATVQHLRVGGVETLLVPLPPLAEQRRIVARLDELMTLCDQLEASLAAGSAKRTGLMEVLLRGALRPASPLEEAA